MSSLTYPPASGHLSRVWTLSCPTCALPATSFDRRAEAVMLAAVHDELHHRGRPTMTVRGAVACEVCGKAATRVDSPAPGTCTVLCTECMFAAAGAPACAGVAA